MNIKEIRGWLDNLANNEDWTADGMRLYAKEALEVLDEIYFNNESIKINNDEDKLDNLFDDLDNLANNEDWTADGMRLYAKEALEVLDEIYFNNESIKINNDEDKLDNLFDDLKEYYDSKVTDIYETYGNNEISEKRKLSELTVNDKVYVECMSSLGASSEGHSFISEVIKKFDENTGEEYKVFLVDNRKFDSKNGSEIRKDGIGMFFIEPA